MALIKREILTSREVLKPKRKAQCEHNNRLNFVRQKQRGVAAGLVVTQLVNAILVFAY